LSLKYFFTTGSNSALRPVECKELSSDEYRLSALNVDWPNLPTSFLFDSVTVNIPDSPWWWFSYTVAMLPFLPWERLSAELSQSFLFPK
jgi:hypothetical protein